MTSVKPLKISYQIKNKKPYYEIELEEKQIREFISYSPITEYLFGFAPNGIGFYIFPKPFSKEIGEVRIMPQGENIFCILELKLT